MGVAHKELLSLTTKCNGRLLCSDVEATILVERLKPAFLATRGAWQDKLTARRRAGDGRGGVTFDTVRESALFLRASVRTPTRTKVMTCSSLVSRLSSLFSRLSVGRHDSVMTVW